MAGWGGWYMVGRLLVSSMGEGMLWDAMAKQVIR